MKTVRLFFWSAITYGILLVLIAGFFPPGSTSTLSLIAIPLAVLTLLLVLDLARRSRGPTASKKVRPNSSFIFSYVKSLSGQVKVAAGASDSYFDNVVRAKLKELLISKVAVETGLEAETIRQTLSDKLRGPDLLDHDDLYRILYGPIPPRGETRTRQIEKATELIGAWRR